MAQAAVFNTHCGTPSITPRNMGIHQVMPDPYPTAAFLSELVRTYKYHVCLYNYNHLVDHDCKKFIIRLIPEKFYKLLSSRINGFTKVTSLDILTHLITEYNKLEEEDVQDIYWQTKEPISKETLFETFVEKNEWNQEAVAVQNPYSTAQIVSMAYRKICQMRVISRRLLQMVAQDMK